MTFNIVVKVKKFWCKSWGFSSTKQTKDCWNFFLFQIVTKKEYQNHEHIFLKISNSWTPEIVVVCSLDYSIYPTSPPTLSFHPHLIVDLVVWELTVFSDLLEHLMANPPQSSKLLQFYVGLRTGFFRIPHLKMMRKQSRWLSVGQQCNPYSTALSHNWTNPQWCAPPQELEKKLFTSESSVEKKVHHRWLFINKKNWNITFPRTGIS